MPNLDALRSAAVEVVEVSPSDGLQNEQILFTTAQKVALIGRMIAAGARRIKVASFARPDRVPQMPHAESVIAALDMPASVALRPISGLVATGPAPAASDGQANFLRLESDRRWRGGKCALEI